MTILYKNRYSDIIYFTDIPEGKVIMNGYLPDGLGVIGTIDNIKAVDPSGGPMISIGENISWAFTDKKERIVEKIEFSPEGVIFIIKQDIKSNG